MRLQRSSAPFPMDRLMTREERKVYTACRDPMTIQDLAAKTKLDDGLVNTIVTQLLSEGIIVDLDGTPVIKSEPIPETPKVDIEGLKAELERTLTQQLGNKAAPYIKQVQACMDIEELEKVARSQVMKLNFAVSQQAGAALNTTIQQLF